MTMTRMPFPSLLPSTSLRSPTFFKFSTTVWYLSMSDKSHFDSPKAHIENGPKQLVPNHPVPLSPLLPFISKDMELQRAMSASSKSSLLSMSISHVLLEDHWLITVDKPQGVYCASVLSSVLSLLNDSSDSHMVATEMNLPEFHLVNRHDRDTSGVMLITKSHKVAAKLVKAFTDHKFRKTYIVFCIGLAPKWGRNTIKSGHGRSKFGASHVYAASDMGRKLPGGSTGRGMETGMEVLLVIGKWCFKVLSELERDEEKIL
ncbi:hypothetical protein RJ640_003461 [Escallonia rubra]|uniref:Pseudouridine synthase RsuA/RluA-like domain-containing protein n=1 Tax=Escallonia rubra TaxID=112253 RepID=A0AA88UBL1_9ASTE|nr:hypothetical protein RJ640_003461 [Escallonia rubra]